MPRYARNDVMGYARNDVMGYARNDVMGYARNDVVARYWQIYAPGRRNDKTDGRTAILSLLTVK